VYVSLWIICDDIVMIIPDIVKDKWKSQPTTLDILKTDLQAEKAKVAKMETQVQANQATVATFETLVMTLLTRVQKLEQR